MAWPMRALDAVAAAGALLFVAALALPWYEVRACPLFEECGPWEAQTGWSYLRFSGLAVLAAVAALLAFVRDAVGKRIALAIVAHLTIVVVGFSTAWADFVIGGDVRGPLVGLALAYAGAGSALVALIASAVYAARHAGPADARPVVP